MVLLCIVFGLFGYFVGRALPRKRIFDSAAITGRAQRPFIGAFFLDGGLASTSLQSGSNLKHETPDISQRKQNTASEPPPPSSTADVVMKNPQPEDFLQNCCETS